MEHKPKTLVTFFSEVKQQVNTYFERDKGSIIIFFKLF